MATGGFNVALASRRIEEREHAKKRQVALDRMVQTRADTVQSKASTCTCCDQVREKLAYATDS